LKAIAVVEGREIVQKNSQRKNSARLRLFVSILIAAPVLGVGSLWASAESMPVEVRQAIPVSTGSSDAINVLILGDSLALCGFGKRLDDRFRKSARVKSTYTYLACGTNPLSWLKERPYSNIKTHCGFVMIESTNSGRIKEANDVYGLPRGHIPGAHPVPKLEDLLASVRPDILIMQTGTNLFDLFPDHKTVSPNTHGPELRSYLVPFINKALRSPSLRKIYWVSAPTSGRVSTEIQDFVVAQTKSDIGNVANVIDSRSLVPYPYHHMEPDKEHFIGADMDLWADKVFDLVEHDLSLQPFASLKPLSEKGSSFAVVQAAPAEDRPKDSQLVTVKAKLLYKTEPIPVSELLPYQEYLVGYLYEINKLMAGQYAENRILVMHPAYIGLKKQKLRYRVGKTYKLQLRDLNDTVWKTVKSKDDSGAMDLQPYIRIQDETKHPEHVR
jgi:hypothetical protein